MVEAAVNNIEDYDLSCYSVSPGNAAVEPGIQMNEMHAATSFMSLTSFMSQLMTLDFYARFARTAFVWASPAPECCFPKCIIAIQMSYFVSHFRPILVQISANSFSFIGTWSWPMACSSKHICCRRRVLYGTLIWWSFSHEAAWGHMHQQSSDGIYKNVQLLAMCLHIYHAQASVDANVYCNWRPSHAFYIHGWWGWGNS